MDTDRRFRRLVRLLRRKCPPLLPVRVYLREGIIDPTDRKVVGLSWLESWNDVPHHFVIVCRRRCWDVIKDTLIHEWAHPLAWQVGHAKHLSKQHGPEWGLAFARVYTVAVPDS